MIDVRGRGPLGGGATPGQVVLAGKREQVEKALQSKRQQRELPQQLLPPDTGPSLSSPIPQRQTLLTSLYTRGTIKTENRGGSFLTVLIQPRFVQPLISGLTRGLKFS